MADARELLIKLTVDAAQADRRLKDISKSVGGLEQGLRTAGGSLKNFVTGLAGAVTIGTVITAFKAAADSMDEMVKAAAKVGTTVENLSALSYAADQSGVSFQGLQTGLLQLNRQLSDVEKGTTDAAKALRALGVKGSDGPEAALSKIADAFASVPDSAQKTAVAMAIFGKSGADLIPLLNAGAEGLDAFKKRAEELGVVIDTDTARKAELFNDSLSDMQKALGGIVKQVTAGALPGMSAMAKAMADSARASKEWQQFGTGLAQVIGHVAGYALKTVATFQALGTVIGGVAAAATLLATGEFRAAGRTLKSMVDDVNNIEASTNDRLAKLRTSLVDMGNAAEPLKKGAEGINKVNAAAKSLASDDKAKQLKEQADALKEYAESLKKIQEIEDEARSFGEKFIRGEAAKADAIREQISALEDAADPLRVWTREMQALEELMATGNLSAAAYSAELQRIGEKLAEASKPAQQAKDEFAEIKDAINGYGKAMAGSFVDAIASGESFGASFKKLTADVLKNLAQMILQKAIFDKLFASGGAGGGFLSGLGKLFGFAKGGAFSSTTGLPYGVYNRPTFFQMPGSGPLQKFARGGVLGEAGPEAIMPLKRGGDGKLGVSAAPVNVNVINNAGAQVRVEQDGNDINVIVDRVRNALTRDIRSGGNVFAGALQGTYGLNRAHS